MSRSASPSGKYSYEEDEEGEGVSGSDDEQAVREQLEAVHVGVGRLKALTPHQRRLWKDALGPGPPHEVGVGGTWKGEWIGFDCRMIEP